MMSDTLEDRDVSICFHLFLFHLFVLDRSIFRTVLYKRGDPPTIVSFLSFLSSGYRRLTISTLRDDRYKYTELISDSCSRYSCLTRTEVELFHRLLNSVHPRPASASAGRS